MDKAKLILLRESLMEKISSDDEIQELGRKCNIEINEGSLRLIFGESNSALEFLAKEAFSNEVSAFCAAEYGFHEKWLSAGVHDWRYRGMLSRAYEAHARKVVRQDGGAALIRGKQSSQFEDESKLIEFITGRKGECGGPISVISRQDILDFYERNLNPDSPDKLSNAEIEAVGSQFSKALRLIMPGALPRDVLERERRFYDDFWRTRVLVQKDAWEGVGIRTLIRKYWSLGLDASPVISIDEILFFFPELWPVVEDSVEVREVYRVLNGCLGLGDFRLLRNSVSQTHLSGLGCFVWFPDIIEQEFDSICWTSFSRNESMEWTEEVICMWSDKINFRHLSSNRSVRWSSRLLRIYEDLWDWELLCESEDVPWDADLIKCFEERIAWPQLSGNSSLPWSEELLGSFADKWTWKRQEGDHIYYGGYSASLVQGSRGKWYSHRYPWGGHSISSNVGIPWTPELLMKYRGELDVWSLAAKGKLSPDCVRFLFDQLFECRPAVSYTAKYSDWSDDQYRVSLTGWHLLFLNENVSVDASLLDDICNMQFKRTPDMAVVGQRWVGPSTSDALDLLFLRPGTRMNFDVELADCIERSSSWGELLIKAALSVCEPSRAESHERKYGIIRSDVRNLLKTCRLDLFDLKRDVWEERKWLVKDELSLKKLFRKFLRHDDFADALASLGSVGVRMSVPEAWMSLFVIACRYRESHGMVDVLKGFNLIKSKDVVEMRPYQDVRIAHSRASMSENPVREIRALHRLNDEAIRSSSVIRILEDYFRWWEPYEQGKDGYFYSAAEYVIFPSKASCDALLFVVLKSLGFVQDNKNSFGISSLDFLYGFLHRA